MFTGLDKTIGSLAREQRREGGIHIHMENTPRLINSGRFARTVGGSRGSAKERKLIALALDDRTTNTEYSRDQLNNSASSEMATPQASVDCLHVSSPGSARGGPLPNPPRR